MAALDTNILVRYLVRDDTKQATHAARLIRSAVDAGDSLLIPVTVVLELEWVLRSNFGFSKEDISGTLSGLLSSIELSFESEGAVDVALSLYSKQGADFADCVHVALAHAAGEQPLWTFDRAASRLDGAKLLTDT